MPLIAGFNINSVRARLDSFLPWLDEVKPDIVLLQETKCVDADFPKEPFEQRGFTVFCHGQKSYNGVAVLTRLPAELVRKNLPFGEDGEDAQARFIEVKIEDYHIASVYLPNGNPVIDSDTGEMAEKFCYKLQWMRHLQEYIAAGLKDNRHMILGGDFNICRQKSDMYDWQKFTDDALFHPQSRKLFHQMLASGMVDAWQALNPNQRGYTYWDLWKGRWQKDEGVRIDYFLLSPMAANGLRNCTVDKSLRGQEKPSDHTPLLITMQG